MNLEPNDLLLFARVVDEGSFSRAAERAGQPKSTVSRRIAHLEAQLGERLLLRTTRKLTVTDFGRSVLEHAHQVLAEVDAPPRWLSSARSSRAGRLRVSMPADFANGVLGQTLADFIARHPAISLELDLSPRRVDLIGENFDVALRMGDLPDDASLAGAPRGGVCDRPVRVAGVSAEPWRAARTRGADGTPGLAPARPQRRTGALDPDSRRRAMAGHPAWPRDLPTRRNC
jgi:DNA-binding transcriptional LysR family regulator